MSGTVVDVRFLAPELVIYREIKDFLRDTRPKRDRVMAAMTFLNNKAPISHEGKGGRRTLRKVALHLVGYYDLDPSFAFHLLTETKTGMDKSGGKVVYRAWNQRCLNEAGRPYPWSDEELWRALEDAVDGAPSYGVYLFKKAQEKDSARRSAASFIEVLTHLPEPSASLWMTPETLYRVFIEFSGLNPKVFHKAELGLEITHAMGQGRLPFVTRARTNSVGRIYIGMDMNTLRVAIDRYEQWNKTFKAAS